MFLFSLLFAGALCACSSYIGVCPTGSMCIHDTDVLDYCTCKLGYYSFSPLLFFGYSKTDCRDEINLAASTLAAAREEYPNFPVQTCFILNPTTGASYNLPSPESQELRLWVSDLYLNLALVTENDYITAMLTYFETFKCNPFILCNGTLSTEVSVCNYHGTCVATDTCSCETGFSGQFCTPNVCNPICIHGDCLSNGTCVCHPGWSKNATGFCAIPDPDIGKAENTALLSSINTTSSRISACLNAILSQNHTLDTAPNCDSTILAIQTDVQNLSSCINRLNSITSVNVSSINECIASLLSQNASGSCDSTILQNDLLNAAACVDKLNGIIDQLENSTDCNTQILYLENELKYANNPIPSPTEVPTWLPIITNFIISPIIAFSTVLLLAFLILKG